MWNNCIQVLFLPLFLEMIYAERIRPIRHLVETDISQVNTTLQITTEKAAAMKARSAKRTKAKKLMNQLSIRNTEVNIAAAVNTLTIKNTPEVIEEDKIKIDYVQDNCSPKFFHGKNRTASNLVIVIYIRSQEQYGQEFAEKLDQISTNYLIDNVAFCLYDLSCNKNTKPINMYIDVILNKTLNNQMAFKIEAVLVDLKIDDLKDLLDIMVAFSIPVFLFTKRDTLTQDITAIYPNIIPMFYDFGVDILTEFLSYYQFTIITILCDSEDYSLNIKDAVTTHIKYFYPQLCISATYFVDMNYNAENILHQVNEDPYTNFVLIISKNVSLVTKFVGGLNSKNKLCYIFFSFEKIKELKAARFVTVSFDNFGTSSSQRVSFRSYKRKVFRNFLNFLKSYRKLLKTLGSEGFENNNKRELPPNISEVVIKLGQARYEVSDGQVNLYHIEVTKNGWSYKTIGTYSFSDGSVFWHNSISFSYSSSCEKIVCNAGFYPVFLVHRCCWRCFACEYGYVKELPGQDLCTKCDPSLSLPNKNKTKCMFFQYENYKISYTKIRAVIILTTLGAIYSASYLLIFVTFKNTPLVRSSNLQLSIFQLILHLCLNMQFTVAVLEQTKLVCYTHVIIWAYLLKGIISIYIVKINQLLTIFNSKVHFHKTKFVTFKEVVTTCTYVMTNIFFTVYTQATKREDAIYEDKNKMVKYRFCYHQSCLYLEIVTVMVLSIIAAVKAFVARKLPSNFNETRYIFLGMFTTNVLLLLMILLDASLNVDGGVVFADSLMIFIINVTVLTITYGYKIYILLFCKEKNQRENIQRKTFEMNKRNVAKKL